MNVRNFLPIIAIAAAACSRGHSETYGFVATLGNDTTSVERVVRRGDRIISDAVGRSPNVVVRHWEAALGPNGTIRKWWMDTHIPNATNGITDIHHEAEFGDSIIRLRTRSNRDSSDVAYRKKYAATVPWNAFIYATYEPLFNVAQSLDDSAHIGQYFFEGWDEGHIGYAIVKELGNGDFSIGSTGLAGTGKGHLDENGRLVSYSGEGTTYKQEVKRVSTVPDIEEIAARFAADEKAHGVRRSLSVRDTVRATIGNTQLTVDYSRPLARGRTLVGGLIPFDQVWRTGANAATQLAVTQPVTVAGVRLDSGTYTLWTIPTKDDVKLILNRQHGQWGTNYDARQDLARVPMTVSTNASNVEQFTIRIDPAGEGKGGALVMEWGAFHWSAPITAR